MAESGLPPALDESDTRKKDGSRNDESAHEPTKLILPDDIPPVKRKGSRRHVEKITGLDNSQEPAGGAVTKDAIPVKKPGIKLGRQIANESKAAYRARISTWGGRQTTAKWRTGKGGYPRREDATRDCVEESNPPGRFGR